MLGLLPDPFDVPRGEGGGLEPAVVVHGLELLERLDQLGIVLGAAELLRRQLARRRRVIGAAVPEGVEERHVDVRILAVVGVERDALQEVVVVPITPGLHRFAGIGVVGAAVVGATGVLPKDRLALDQSRQPGELVGRHPGGLDLRAGPINVDSLGQALPERREVGVSRFAVRLRIVRPAVAPVEGRTEEDAEVRKLRRDGGIHLVQEIHVRLAGSAEIVDVLGTEIEPIVVVQQAQVAACLGQRQPRLDHQPQVVLRL